MPEWRSSRENYIDLSFEAKKYQLIDHCILLFAVFRDKSTLCIHKNSQIEYCYSLNTIYERVVL